MHVVSIVLRFESGVRSGKAVSCHGVSFPEVTCKGNNKTYMASQPYLLTFNIFLLKVENLC